MSTPIGDQYRTLQPKHLRAAFEREGWIKSGTDTYRTFYRTPDNRDEAQVWDISTTLRQYASLAGVCVAQLMQWGGPAAVARLWDDANPPEKTP